MRLAHVRETLYRFGEVFNGFVCIAVFDAVPDTVLDVSLQSAVQIVSVHTLFHAILPPAAVL